MIITALGLNETRFDVLVQYAMREICIGFLLSYNHHVPLCVFS